MACYFDDADWERKNGFSGHLIADSLVELHEMANLLGLDKDKFVGTAPVPHYQLHVNKHEVASKAGAWHLCRKAFTAQAAICRDKINRQLDREKLASNTKQRKPEYRERNEAHSGTHTKDGQLTLL